MTVKQWVILAGSVVAVLLLAVAILLGVIVAQNARAADQDRSDRARETCEELIGPMTNDNLDEYAECADRLLNR
jgi:hypothetical protein